MFRFSARARALVLAVLLSTLAASPLPAATAVDSTGYAREDTSTPVVKIALSRSDATVGTTLRTKVRVAHGAPGQKATLQLKQGKGWSGVASEKLPKFGRTKSVLFKTILMAERTYIYRVKLTAKGSATAAQSKPKSVTVRAATQPPPPPTPTPAPAPHVPTPLKLNLVGATGLAMPSGSSSQAAAASTTTTRLASQSTTAASTGSNLSVVTPTGQTRDAIVSGTANVQEFLIAPNGKVYLYFRTRVNLADTSLPAYGPNGCLLAEVDEETGEPRCIDSTLASINWPQDSGNPSNPPIQFDESGAIYYWGRSAIGNAVLRRYQAGTTADLINDNVYLNNFLVQPDASVIVAGGTTSTGALWTRRITPQGGIQTLFSNPSYLGLTRLSDGNVYFFDNYEAYHVRRFLSDTSQMDAKLWLAGYSPSPVDSHSTCPQFYNCSGMHMNKTAQTAGGSAFALDGYMSASGQYQRQPLKIFPTVEAANVSTIANVNMLHAVGNYLLLSGVNAQGANVLARYNASTGAETQLLGPSTEIELYHVNPTGGNMAWFDGLRFSDNRVVVGQINVATGQVSIAGTVGAKWEDFQTFAP